MVGTTTRWSWWSRPSTMEYGASSSSSPVSACILPWMFSSVVWRRRSDLSNSSGSRVKPWASVGSSSSPEAMSFSSKRGIRRLGSGCGVNAWLAGSWVGVSQSLGGSGVAGCGGGFLADRLGSWVFGGVSIMGSSRSESSESSCGPAEFWFPRGVSEESDSASDSSGESDSAGAVVRRFLGGDLDLVGSLCPRSLLEGVSRSLDLSSCSCLLLALSIVWLVILRFEEEACDLSVGGGLPWEGCDLVAAAETVSVGGRLARLDGWKKGRMFSGLLMV